MKNILSLLFISLFALNSSSQISNSSFENWYSDSTTFSFAPFIPLDTFPFSSPVDWTCSNSITMSGGLHHSQFADSTASSFAGSKALYLRTDTIYIDAASIYLVIPGFVLNGNFTLHLSDVLNGNGGLNPATISGAGVPFTAKPKALGFHLKYFPVVDDSCLIWAILKKGNLKIAEARFNTTQTFNSYTYFEKDFTYFSCENPDTLVILLSSSNPNFTTLGSGSTGLQRGSELFIDSVQLVDFANGHNFSPIALRDVAFTIWNNTKTIDVLANDSDCENDSLTVTVTTNPVHGTAIINLSKQIVYTPDVNYSGKDSLQYSLNDGHSMATVTVEISIFNTSGVDELTGNNFSIFPNPASSLLTVKSTTVDGFRFQLVNLQGQLVKEISSTDNVVVLNTEDLSNGIYLVKILSPQKNSVLTKRIAILH